MIRSDATVVEVGEGYAWVEVRRQSACGSCSVGGSCGTSTIAKLLGEKLQRFQVRDDCGVRPGEQVVIGVSDEVLTKASFSAYLLPLFFLVGMAGLVDSLGATQGWVALAGLVGLGAGLMTAGRIAGRSSASYQPKLIRRQAHLTLMGFENQRKRHERRNPEHC